MALGYKIALTNVWWKRGGQDIRLFANTTEQQTYFSNLGLYWNDLVNFNMNDNITTTITFKDKSGRDAETLLKCNYAIVWNTIKSTYRYYYIVSISQDSANQVVVSLDLDDVQTNFIGNTDKYTNVFVKKWTGANLVKDGFSITYMYNYSKKSFASENDSPTLYNKESIESKIAYTSDGTLNEWLNNNIRAWRYCFITENADIKGYSPYDIAHDPDNPSAYTKIVEDEFRGVLKNGTTMKMPYKAYSCPVYKSGSKKIYIRYNYGGVNYDSLLSDTSIDLLFNNTGNKANPKGTYCFEEKLSNIPPFSYIKNTDYVIENGDLYIIGNALSDSHAPIILENVNHDTITACYLCGYSLTSNCILTCVEQSTSKYSFIVDLPTNLLSGFTDANNDTKLLDMDYTRFRLRIANQFYDYNALALLSSEITTLSGYYTEILKAGTSRIYLRLNASGEYKTPNESDYTGLSASFDLTEPILSNNQWADYFASHKNYYMQTAFNNCLTFGQNINNTIGSTAQSVSWQQGLVRGIQGTINTGSNLLGAIYNQKFERENMQQSPNSLVNVNGDPYYITLNSGLKPYLDYLTISDATKQSILSKFRLYGITYNKIMPLSEILFHHTQYCVLSCEIDKTTLNMSEKEYNRIKETLSGILRFWYNDNVDFSAPNTYLP